MSSEQELRSEVTDFIDTLRTKYGQEFTLGTILIVADVLHKGEDGFTYTIEHECSDPRAWVQEALLDQMYSKLEPKVRTDDDDD